MPAESSDINLTIVVGANIAYNKLAQYKDPTQLETLINQMVEAKCNAIMQELIKFENTVENQEESVAKQNLQQQISDKKVKEQPILESKKVEEAAREKEQARLRQTEQQQAIEASIKKELVKALTISQGLIEQEAKKSKIQVTGPQKFLTKLIDKVNQYKAENIKTKERDKLDEKNNVIAQQIGNSGGLVAVAASIIPPGITEIIDKAVDNVIKSKVDAMQPGPQKNIATKAAKIVQHKHGEAHDKAKRNADSFLGNRDVKPKAKDDLALLKEHPSDDLMKTLSKRHSKSESHASTADIGNLEPTKTPSHSNPRAKDDLNMLPSRGGRSTHSRSPY